MANDDTTPMGEVPLGDRLCKSLDYLHWRHLAGAVLDVFRENQKREGDGEAERKASADEWSICDGPRREIHDRARAIWCCRTGKGANWWPYNEDATSRLYFRFRKRNKAEVEGFAREITLADFGGK